MECEFNSLIEVSDYLGRKIFVLGFRGVLAFRAIALRLARIKVA